MKPVILWIVLADDDFEGAFDDKEDACKCGAEAITHYQNITKVEVKKVEATFKEVE